MSGIKEKSPETLVKEVVLSFMEALNKDDFSGARKLIADDLQFKGVMGSRDGADVYIQDMQKMKFKYVIQNAFVDKRDVCLIYDINMGGPVIRSCGLYHVKDGKIKTINVIFDPRPLLS
jgi:limonene-1,2-epoxide hydrolase